MWSQAGAFAAGLGPWVVLFLGWTVVVVREFTRGPLVRSGRAFTVRFGMFSLEVGRRDS
jgi:hypothetical protein